MKYLEIGADPFPPYQYIDENGKVKGSDYETVKSVIDKMEYNANYSIEDWSIIEKRFINKEIDIVFQVQKTPEREKKYHFSKKLRDAVTSIITSTDNDFNYDNISNLFKKGDKLGVIENYQYGEVIDSIDLDSKKYYKTLEDILTDVNKGLVKFGVVDLGVYEYMNKDNVYKNIKVIDNLNFNRPLYVAFNDEFLKDKFNNYLD